MCKRLTGSNECKGSNGREQVWEGELSDHNGGLTPVKGEKR